MKHDFSIRDIVGALKTVRGVKNYYSDAQLAHLVDEAREVNAILDALPEPEHQLLVRGWKAEELTTEIIKLQGLLGSADTVLEWLRATRDMLVTGVGIDEVKAITRDWNYGPMTPEKLAQIADALPDPVADEWEQCEFSDIRKGDRVLMIRPGIRTEFEQPVKERHLAHLVLEDNVECSKFSSATYYRIPAPVKTPDPDEHELIFVFKTENWDYMVSHGRQLVIWDGSDYVNSNITVKPENIIDWSPAEATLAGDV